MSVFIKSQPPATMSSRHYCEVDRSLVPMSLSVDRRQIPAGVYTHVFTLCLLLAASSLRKFTVDAACAARATPASATAQLRPGSDIRVGVTVVSAAWSRPIPAIDNVVGDRQRASSVITSLFVHAFPAPVIRPLRPGKPVHPGPSSNVGIHL